MVIDVGGGTTEVAVISLGSIVTKTSVRAAGNDMDMAIASHIQKYYQIAIGTQTAEQLKIELGSAFPMSEEGAAEVRGRDLVTGLPKTVVITTEEIREAIAPAVAAIVEAVRDTLNRTPPSVGYVLVKAEVLERPPDATGRLVQLLPVGLRRVFFFGVYREGHGPVDGPHVDVGVGDLKPRYREPDLFRPEALLDGFADGLGDGHQVRGQPWAEVDPVAGLVFGDDERVPRGEGGDVQEGRARIVAPDEAGRHLPLDDAREHRRQAPLLLPRAR